MIVLLLLLAGAASLHAQPLSYGVKVGSPANNPNDSTPYSNSSNSRWMGGPFVELHLPLRFSVEFSALARTDRTQQMFPMPGFTQGSYLFSSVDRVTTWDLPLLLKHRFRTGAFRPFVGAGGAWSHRRSSFESSMSCLGPQGTCDNPSILYGGERKSTLTRFGPAASAGFDIASFKHVTISPEVRWNRAFSGGRTKDQISILVGFSFGR